MAVPTRADVDVLVRQRLAGDPAFRDQLLADPRAAISSLIGIDLPDVVTVTVHEETLTSLHIVLPSVPASSELSDDDLELVAGGACWTNCGIFG